METKAWSVRDARRAPHSGVVVIAARVPKFLPLASPDKFRIVLLTERRRVPTPLDGTAICVPSEGVSSLPSDIYANSLDPQTMAAYRDGEIVCVLPLAATPADIFPSRARRPRLDRLALEIIDATRVEQIASFIAVIGALLQAPASVDRLTELERRLFPADKRERPPARAPGIVRLRTAVKALRAGCVPETSFEAFTADLHLLKLFARDDRWSPRAVRRLLADVEPTARPVARPAPVAPMRQRRTPAR